MRIANAGRAALVGIALVALAACSPTSTSSNAVEGTPTASGSVLSSTAPPAASAVPSVVRMATSDAPTTLAATARETDAPQPGATQADVVRSTSAALIELQQLPVKGRAPMTGYSRDQFGPAWPSIDGCDERNDTLRRDLTGITLEGSCVVRSGTLVSPYTGVTIHFVRGPNSADVQIDHVVALGDAWQTGAQAWTSAQREAFANDPAELLAVDAHSNEQKGDADAASWLPSNKAFRCAYVSIQVNVKGRYHLWVTQAEHDAIARVLATCTTSAITTAATSTTTTTAATPAAPPAPTTTTAATPTAAATHDYVTPRRVLLDPGRHRI